MKAANSRSDLGAASRVASSRAVRNLRAPRHRASHDDARSRRFSLDFIDCRTPGGIVFWSVLFGLAFVRRGARRPLGRSRGVLPFILDFFMHHRTWPCGDATAHVGLACGVVAQGWWWLSSPSSRSSADLRGRARGTELRRTPVRSVRVVLLLHLATRPGHRGEMISVPGDLGRAAQRMRQ